MFYPNLNNHELHVYLIKQLKKEEEEEEKNVK
jgi:hypothetical protein